MMTTKQPVRTTIFIGLIFGLIILTAGIFFEHTVFWPIIFRLVIFTGLSVYSLILASWAGKSRFSIIFPLIFLFFFIFGQLPHTTFLMLNIGMLSWIRSGVCFNKAFSRSLGAEIILSIGGGAMVACFNPYSPVTWALGIWMFFLIQSLYFIIMMDFVSDKDVMDIDPFEKAKMRAEKILKV